MKQQIVIVNFEQPSLQLRIEDDWHTSALNVVHWCAKALVEFTSDDVRTNAVKAGLKDPDHPNAWGSVFKQASKHGWIGRTGSSIPSRLPLAHRRRVSVWKSNLQQLVAK